MPSYVKGNLINVFYATKVGNDTVWKYFAHTTSNSLQMSSQTNEISSKDLGNHPDHEVTSQNWTMSGEFYFTTENANVAMAMANSAKRISFAFAKVSNPDSAAADGLKPVTGYGNETAWTKGTDFVQYGSARCTSFSITAAQGEVCTCSTEFTGDGALSSTAPVTPEYYAEVASE